METMQKRLLDDSDALQLMETEEGTERQEKKTKSSWAQ